MATYIQSLQDYLTSTDTYFGTTDNYWIDILSLSSVFSEDTSNTLKDILTVVSTFKTGGNTSRTLIDSLQLTDSFSPGVNRLEFIGRPLPNFNVPVANPQPPTLTIGDLGPFNIGTATYPEAIVTFASNGVSMTLKAPEFANKDLYQEKRINTNTRGLTLILYRDPIWPDSTTYDVNFTLLDEDEMSLILRFLRFTVGQIVNYTDMYGIVHTGFITDPESPATSAAGGYSVKFTFLEATPA